MKISDLEGKEITVTDLELANMQADDCRYYRHTDPSFKLLDEGLKAYWEDIYQKLLGLRNGLNSRRPATCCFHPQQAGRRVGSPDFQKINPASGYPCFSETLAYFKRDDISERMIY